MCCAGGGLLGSGPALPCPALPCPALVGRPAHGAYWASSFSESQPCPGNSKQQQARAKGQKNQNFVVLVRIHMIPMGTKGNHTPVEQRAHRWRPGTGGASGGPRLQTLSKIAKKCHFLADHPHGHCVMHHITCPAVLCESTPPPPPAAAYGTCTCTCLRSTGRYVQAISARQQT